MSLIKFTFFIKLRLISLPSRKKASNAFILDDIGNNRIIQAFGGEFYVTYRINER